ncbi:MAG: O-antigen ligase family protein [Gemmatimonadota bacterium]|nr:MAG: O-antigen ligase family protein [Gemmatimonadota bacterium]
MSMPPEGEAPARAAGLLLVSLIVLLALFPPETRGESLAGCAALLALFGALSWGRPSPPAGRAWLMVLLASAWPLVLAADAPGPAVRPLVIFVLAGAAGLCAAGGASRSGADRSIAWTVAVAGLLVAVHAFCQVAFGLETAARWIETAGQLPDRELILERLRQGRPFAAFATPASLGGYLALALPITLGLVAEERRIGRVAALAIAFAQLGGLLASGSATAGAALLGAAALFLFVARPRDRLRVGLSVLLAMTLLASVLWSRRAEVFDADRWDSPWRLRAGNFAVAARMVADNPWLGVGPGGFGEAFPRYRLPHHNEALHVHDLPLEMAADLGIGPGLLVSLLFFVVFLGPLRRLRSEPVGWRTGAGVGLAAFALHNLVDFTARLPSVLWTASLLRGVLDTPPLEGRRRPSGVAGAVLTVGTAAAAVLAIAIGLASNALFQAREAVARGEVARALDLSRRATRLAPWDPNGWLFRAQALLDAGEDPERALAAAERAVDRSPVRPAARAARARAREALGDLPGAFADLAEAARLYPAQDDYVRMRDGIGARAPRRSRPEVVQ